MVTTSRVDRHTCRLVDHDDIIIFVDDADWRGSDGRLMSVCSMGYNVAILDRSSNGGHRLAIENNCAAFYGIFLGPMIC